MTGSVSGRELDPFDRAELELRVEDDERIPYQGWDLDAPKPKPRPVRHEYALIGLGICIGIILAFLLITISAALIAAPRSAALPTSSSPALDVRPGSAGPSTPATATSGAPLSGAPPEREGGTASPMDRHDGGAARARGRHSLAGPRYSAQATYCAPTATRCQSWGGDARFGAVYSFTDGDRPYWVRVWRGEDQVDVLVLSHCACQHRDDRIDLSPAAFAELAPLDRGRIDVEVEFLPPGHLGPPPRTDVEDQHPQDPPEHPDDARMRLEAADDEAYP